MEDAAFWVLGGLASLIGAGLTGLGLHDWHQRRRLEALGRRRKDHIQL